MGQLHSEYQTSEKVTIDYELASIPLRFAAYIIDLLFKYLAIIVLYIVLIITLPTSAIFMGKSGDQSLAGWIFAGIAAFFGIAVFIWFVFYHIIFEFLWKGQTPGKKIVKIRVIHDDGTYIGFFTVLLRNLFKIIDYLPINYITGFITMLINKQNKRIGDLVAGTIVVKEQKVTLPQMEEIAGEDCFAHIDSFDTLFSKEEKDVFLNYYHSKKDLAPEAVRKIEDKLLPLIESKTSVEKPLSFTADDFISLAIKKIFKASR